MDKQELVCIIKRAGGKTHAIGYADELLQKVNKLEENGGFCGLMKQFKTSSEEGDFRGRVLEINFANCFIEKCFDLTGPAKQGGSGDVDFLWKLENYNIYIEVKLLRQDKKTLDSIKQQLQKNGKFSVFKSVNGDIIRLQRSILEKSSLKKFSHSPKSSWINLIGIDISELQLGAVGIRDCLLAAGGHQALQYYFNESEFCPDVIGVFEDINGRKLSNGQSTWVSGIHKIEDNFPHPRDYIHGVVFFFRNPIETAALSYKFVSVVVWNNNIVDDETRFNITSSLKQILPFRIT